MIDLVTVVFDAEIELIKTQAKSINLYVPNTLVDSIYVIVNDDESVCDKINLDWWRRYKSQVKIIHYSNLSSAPSSMAGWDSQQLLKILAAAQSKSQYSLVLDAKTWFIKPVSEQLFFDNQGRAYASLMHLFEEFKSAEKFLTDFFNKNYEHIIGPGGVPFAFHVPTLRNMIDHIEQTTNSKFDEFFRNNCVFPNNITEFTLYSAYVLYENIFHQIYKNHQSYEVVNIADFQVHEIDYLINLMYSERTLTASIHRNVYKLLSDNQFKKWCQFLSDKRLFITPEIAQNQLNIFRTGVSNGTGIRL